MINHHLSLRESLECLEGACALVKNLLTTQMEHKPAPLLYELFICYLQRLPQTKQIQNLVTSFQLKLLRHEGLFGLTPYCSHCKEDLITHYIVQGTSFCETHKPMPGISLTPFEAKTLFTLAFSRSFSLIEENEIDPSLKEKINWIIESL